MMFYSMIEHTRDEVDVDAIDVERDTEPPPPPPQSPSPSSPPNRNSICTYYYMLVGIVSILPWALTFSVFDYFKHCLGESCSSIVVLIQLPHLAANVWCASVTIKKSPIHVLRRRMYIGLLAQMALISTFIFIFLFLSEHKMVVYYMFMFFAALLNLASAVVGNSAYGLVIISGRINIIAHQIGCAIGGLSIAIVYATPMANRMLFIYFYLSMSLTLSLLCTVLTGHFIHIFVSQIDAGAVLDIQDEHYDRSLSNATRALHCANLFALSFTTMNMYPLMFQHILPYSGRVNLITDFSPILVTFIVFNVAILCGALVVNVCTALNDYVLTSLVMIKVVMVPLFYLGNFVSPNIDARHEPLLPSNDFYMTSVIAFGVITGYLGTMCILKISGHERGTARITRSGRVAAAMLAIGSMSGVLISQYSFKLL